jgi:Suppressor of fused protein (SUFU)
MNSHNHEIQSHYERIWSNTGTLITWELGPMAKLSPSFSILQFPPKEGREMWTYATCGMSQSNEKRSIELHIFSPFEAKELVELLTVIAYYHVTETPLAQSHTVNFGRPWLPGSNCDHGLISLPYLDGYELEQVVVETCEVQCLWLIPVTVREVDYKKKEGIEALEEKFDISLFNYLDIYRKSVV